MRGQFRSGRVAGALLVLVLLGGSGAGCGGEGIGDVEKRLRDELSDQLDRQRAREDSLRESGGLDSGRTLTPTVDRVDCPGGAKTDAGSSFRCRAIGPGDRVVGTLSVTMLGGGKPAWQFTAAVGP